MSLCWGDFVFKGAMSKGKINGQVAQGFGFDEGGWREDVSL